MTAAPVQVEVSMLLRLTATVRLPHLWPDGPPADLTADQLAEAVRESMDTDDRTDQAFYDALVEDGIRLLAIAPAAEYDVHRITAVVPNPAHGQADGLPGIDPPPATTTVVWTEGVRDG